MVHVATKGVEGSVLCTIAIDIPEAATAEFGEWKTKVNFSPLTPSTGKLGVSSAKCCRLLVICCIAASKEKAFYKALVST